MAQHAASETAPGGAFIASAASTASAASAASTASTASTSTVGVRDRSTADVCSCVGAVGIRRRTTSSLRAYAVAALFVMTSAVVLVDTDAQGGRIPMWQRTVRNKAAECKNITNATDHDVAAVRSYYRNLSENAKCLLKCVYEQLGIIRNNQFIEQKEGLQLFHQYFAHDKMTLKLGMLVVGKCLARGRSASNPCQGAYQARICFLAFRL